MGALDMRSVRRDSPAWGWALGGALVCPAIVLAGSLRPRFPALAILCLAISASGIAAGAAITAIRRGDLSWNRAAAIWLVAYAAGAVTYALWPQRSEPLARAGQVNQITLPPGDSSEDLFRETRVEISDGDAALFERAVAALLVFGLLGGGLNALRVVPSGRKLRSAAAAGAAWALGSTFLLPVLLVIGVYVTHLLGELFKPVSEPLGHAIGWVLTGTVCGLLVGTIGETTLNRFLQPRVQSSQ
jgi:hypothetical protein